MLLSQELPKKENTVCYGKGCAGVSKQHLAKSQKNGRGVKESCNFGGLKGCDSPQKKPWTVTGNEVKPLGEGDNGSKNSAISRWALWLFMVKKSETPHHLL